MPWVLRDDAYIDITKELNKQHDRAAAIVAAAILEDHLLAAIKSTIAKDEAIEAKLFTGSGPLATFSAKIDLGLLLGLYEKTSHKRLHIIRQIRNEFAHNMRHVTFNSQRIKDFCKNITYTKVQVRQAKEIFKGLPEDINMLRGRQTPRRNYIRSIQLYTSILTLSIRINDHLRALQSGEQPTGEVDLTIAK